MDHPFDGVWAKFDASLEHFEALSDQTNAFLGEPYPYDVQMQFDHGESCFRLFGHIKEQPPLSISTRIGDVIHNLSSALDHAAFALAKLRTGREIDRTSFPIFGDIRVYRKFRRRRDCWMRHINLGDRALLQRFQPYRGGNFAFNEPLAALYLLWNEDKHRVLHTTLALLAGYGGKVTLVRDVTGIMAITPTLGPIEDGAEILRIDVLTNGPSPQVKLESELHIKVAFDEGYPVRETLASLGDDVEHILGEIEGRFPTRSSLTHWKPVRPMPSVELDE